MTQLSEIKKRLLLFIGVGCIRPLGGGPGEDSEHERTPTPRTTGEIIDRFDYHPAYLLDRMMELQKDGWIRREVERPETHKVVWLLTNVNVDPCRPWIAVTESAVAA